MMPSDTAAVPPVNRREIDARARAEQRIRELLRELTE